jgi:hypothetical protein
MACRYMYNLYHWAHGIGILISVIPASSMKRLQTESHLRSVYVRSLHFIQPLQETQVNRQLIKKSLGQELLSTSAMTDSFCVFFQLVTFEIMLLFDAILTRKLVADGKTYSLFRHREPGEHSEYGDYSMG